MFKNKDNGNKFLLVKSSEIQKYESDQTLSDAKKFFDEFNIPNEYRNFIIKFDYSSGHLLVSDFISGVNYEVGSSDVSKTQKLFVGLSKSRDRFNEADTRFEKVVSKSDFIDENKLLEYIDLLEENINTEDYIMAIRSFYARKPVRQLRFYK